MIVCWAKRLVQMIMDKVRDYIALTLVRFVSRNPNLSLHFVPLGIVGTFWVTIPTRLSVYRTCKKAIMPIQVHKDHEGKIARYVVGSSRNKLKDGASKAIR